MLTVQIWSDIVCPWCYIGKRRWEKALAAFPHAGQVRVLWRAFELRTNQPRVPGDRLADLMVTNYAMQRSEVAEVFDRLRTLGAQEGITLHPQHIRPVNSFDAHRFVALAAERGATDTVIDRLFRAYHTDVRNIADHDVLREIASEAGLADNDVAAMLRGDRWTEEIRVQEAAARTAGVTAVPSFVIDGHQKLHGAVSADAMLAMLNEEWAKKTPAEEGHPTQAT